MATTRGRTRYEGFRATIRTVGTGPRGSRALTFEEARDAMARLLAGEVSEAQAGAFLLAMRVKGEEPEELAGFTQALRRAPPAPGGGTLPPPRAGARAGGGGA